MVANLTEADRPRITVLLGNRPIEELVVDVLEGGPLALAAAQKLQQGGAAVVPHVLEVHADALWTARSWVDHGTPALQVGRAILDAVLAVLVAQHADARRAVAAAFGRMDSHPVDVPGAVSADLLATLDDDAIGPILRAVAGTDRQAELGATAARRLADQLARPARLAEVEAALRLEAGRTVDPPARSSATLAALLSAADKLAEVLRRNRMHPCSGVLAWPRDSSTACEPAQALPARARRSRRSTKVGGRRCG